jgi:hypothetical protein
MKNLCISALYALWVWVDFLVRKKSESKWVMVGEDVVVRRGI